MKRVFLIVGCVLGPVGFLVLIMAGSVWSVGVGYDGNGCNHCGLVIRVNEGEPVEISEGPAIDFDKTVGLDPQSCATSNGVTVPSSGGTVFYCYKVHNSGDLTLTLHTVVDDKLGLLLGPGYPVPLVPGATVLFTIGVGITETTVNSAIWKAYNPGPIDVVTGTDSAVVTVEGPITALTATNDGPTAIGRATSFKATISGGGFETYAWDFGDSMTGTGAITSHIYPALGVYTAVVTATNAFNSLTATTVVTVIYPPVYLPSVLRP